ncbi:hemerythrin domain-containing protein [Streptomyces decoyicus]|uniref:hemerythrin domain-containing protein n=1 Tax=Streptomyces decoyicus TaxID=249567 RepID=UPI00363C01F5
MDALTIELVRHSVAEDQYLYPAARAYLEFGSSLADKELRDHARIERLLEYLKQRQPLDEDFEHLVRRLRAEVTVHVDDEENSLFLQMRSNVDAAVLQELGGKVSPLEEDRPHPPAPRYPGHTACYAEVLTHRSVLWASTRALMRVSTLLTGCGSSRRPSRRRSAT